MAILENDVCAGLRQEMGGDVIESDLSQAL